MTVTIIKGLWKEGSIIKKNYFEGACGHMVVKGRHQEIIFYCEGAYDHTVLWNFRLCYETLRLGEEKSVTRRVVSDILRKKKKHRVYWCECLLSILCSAWKYQKFCLVEVGLRAHNVIWNFRAPCDHKHFHNKTKIMYDYYIAMTSMFLVVKLFSHPSIVYANFTILLPWTKHKQHQNHFKPKAFQKPKLQF